MASSLCDINFDELAQFAVAFYIGGTKNGALNGEAVVIVNPELKPYFRYNINKKEHLEPKVVLPVFSSMCYLPTNYILN
jgi:threonine aldolase